VEVLEVYTKVPGLFVVEPLELLRAHLELDRDHALWEHEHRIDPPAEPRDVELEVDRTTLVRGGATQRNPGPKGLTLKCTGVYFVPAAGKPVTLRAWP
jgi:hypothetical protein